MASEKQIRANRENAKKSTGPTTAAGSLKSSRNAFRHGLSLPLELDPETSEKAKLLVQTFANEGRSLAMSEIVHAQLDLLRIRTVRNQMLAEPDLLAGDLHQLRRLRALDRYECIAAARRRRAAASLAPIRKTLRSTKMGAKKMGANLSERTQFQRKVVEKGARSANYPEG